jgi:hypothetical protein
MSESMIDILVLSLSCGLLFGVAGVGILALPWKDDELVDTSRAVRQAWRRLDESLRTAVLRPSPPRGPAVSPFRRGYLSEAPSVAFEPPSIPA